MGIFHTPHTYYRWIAQPTYREGATLTYPDPYMKVVAFALNESVAPQTLRNAAEELYNGACQKSLLMSFPHILWMEFALFGLSSKNPY